MISELAKRLFFAVEPVITNSLRGPKMLERRLSDRRYLTVLMYHSIPEAAPGAGLGYYDIRVPLRDFAEQMDYLDANGYAVIGLEEYIGMAAGNGSLPRDAVAVTFDDGYRDNYTNAFPVLRQHGFTATVFLATDYMDLKHATAFVSEETGISEGPEMLRWEEIGEMSENGITFGSHTMSHKRLDSLTDKDFEYEISRSKGIIEERTGRNVSCFCFPYAFPGGMTSKRFRERSGQALRDSGYRLGVTTAIGRNLPGSDIFFLRRIPVHVGDSLRRFSAKLSGAYDWVAAFQSCIKAVQQRDTG
jgi:peptidoglycan/xylan/chitin deacetylase (PgdA/CDA1 family)